ncbi:aromatic acid decarboxylase [Solemya pervernicosa gill symbiont]|uniref:Flavin prenyltransferase UbiX n=3 Tax=Gammaproteobacteria incertae sedis TaxID=118884 RepID=A0A1T2L0P9_9GAMM|nr:flavin prenyltransferase UbiX [Candidatus Reidiella endopervernicosa]OOZ38661.1 aromatic acid decarboxylase [Solemya pervernicosa gill symbiont]QKQ28191.1 UbiX family flavin prenyltransferase [Candidatus Reidiella endopervernicosa]
MTGASGAPYGLRLLQLLLEAGETVYLMLSDAGRLVLDMESGLKLSSASKEAEQQLCSHFDVEPGQLQLFGKQQWMAPVASGTNPPRAMVVCPCSAGTLASIAMGLSDNLIERAADVMLKERRKLILVPREMPLSEIHLENMLKLARMGAIIMPPSPGFYQQPQTIDDLVDFVVARILDHLDIDHALQARWGES